jgi:5'-nucleotidase
LEPNSFRSIRRVPLLKVLLVNDDGIHAPGLVAMERALSSWAEVWTVAPLEEQSAKSHSFSLREPLRVEEMGERRFGVSGSPADCTYMALHALLPEPPGLVVSGINQGANLGNDVPYSGTAAAAREACIAGVPSLAISLRASRGAQSHWETACEVGLRVGRSLLSEPLPPYVFLNVNVPNVPLDELRGLRTTVQGPRVYERAVHKKTDPFGRTYYWVGGPHKEFLEATGAPEGLMADGIAMEKGWASVTPVSVFATDINSLATVRGWTDA